MRRGDWKNEGYLKRVARRQEVRHDKRLPIEWLRAVLSRYENQRIECAVEGGKDGAPLVINGIYVTMQKIGPNMFSIDVRGAVFDGEKRGRGMMFSIPVASIVETPKGQPFWRALHKQLVVLKLKEAVVRSGGGGT